VNPAKSAFLATMSHEIRTPMNRVLGMVNLMRRTTLDDRQQHYLDAIHKSGKHLLAIINDILDFSKIEAGKIELARDDFRVSELLQDTIGLIKEAARAKRHQLRVVRNMADLDLCGDKIRLQQALVNFLGNALKFTESGTITLSCRLAQETDERCLMRFEVTDIGNGMTPEQQASVIEAFEQADNRISRKYQGTGLGLSITKRIAQLMGGEAGVRSTLRTGSTFWLTCWLDRGHRNLSTPTHATESPEAVLKRDHAGHRILVVDDEPVNREIVAILLEECGLTVDMATDGQEAVNEIRDHEYDLVLMDMQMPLMDGLQAAREIRQLPGKADLVIMDVTANAFDDDRVRCLNAGMNDFIAKPYDPNDLFAKLVQWLGQPR
jgi:two-component system sensor histidine kinase/response regulator